MKQRGTTWLRAAAFAASAIVSGVGNAAEPTSAAAGAPNALTPPRPLVDTAVPYPTGASGEAEIVLELVVARDGTVSGASVTQGDAPFAEAALAAARAWRFEPARRAGVAVPARIRFSVRFAQIPSVDEAPAPASATPPQPSASGVRAPLTKAPVTTPAVTAAPTGEAPRAITVRGERKPLATVLSRTEVRMLPGALSDPLRAIESFPGVTPTLSGAPYFYVRGAPPGDVGYSFDDVRLPALFHAIGGPSVIHPALVDRVEFYPGPYPVSFGRAAGGIVAALSNRTPGPAHGEFSLRATDSSAFVATPLAGDRAELTLAGRYSYANPVLRLFAPDFSVSYWDYQARLRLFPNPREQLSLLVFGAHDLLTAEREEDTAVLYGITFHRVDLRYDRQLDSGSAQAGLVFGWDRSSARDGQARIEDLSLRARGKLEQELGPNTKLYLGGDAGHVRYSAAVGAVDDPEARAELLRRYSSRSDSVAGAYIGVQLGVAHGVTVEPGVRADAYVSREHWTLGVDPRVIAEFQLTPRLTLVHGLGIAHQPPADPLPQPGIDPPLDGGLQTAVQSSAGVRWALPKDVSLQATLFQSILVNLTDNAGQSRLDDGRSASNEDVRALGNTRGVELLVKRSLARTWGGYLVYTLSSSRRSVGRAEGPAAFDRTHVLGAALSHDFGAGYRGGVRGMFYSGIPARVAYLAAARHPPRTPPFYRIDTRAEKRWTLAGGSYLSLVFEVLNTTLNQEVINESCNAYVCQETRSGPVTIPNIGLEGGF